MSGEKPRRGARDDNSKVFGLSTWEDDNCMNRRKDARRNRWFGVKK